LRYRNLFASNRGPHEEKKENNNNNKSKEKTTTIATRANNKINEESNSLSRKISVFASFVECLLTVIVGIVRGLTMSGVLPCKIAILILVVVQVIVLLWAIVVRSSLSPVTNTINIIMAMLLTAASFATLFRYESAGSFAVSVAMILSCVGTGLTIIRLGLRKVLGIIIYPKRENIAEEITRMNAMNSILGAPLLARNTQPSNEAILINDSDSVEMPTAPHSPRQRPAPGPIRRQPEEQQNINNNQHHATSSTRFEIRPALDDFDFDLAYLLPDAPHQRNNKNNQIDLDFDF
jgi:hypothetical protein